MNRRLFLFAVATPMLRADALQEIFDLFTAMASGLSAGNAEPFLQGIDPKMPSYEDLARNIRALLEQWDVLAAVEVTGDSGDDRHHDVALDWMLQITNKFDPLRLVRRQQTVKCRLEKQKKWRIVALDPLSFFTPPTVQQG